MRKDGGRTGGCVSENNHILSREVMRKLQHSNKPMMSYHVSMHSMMYFASLLCVVFIKKSLVFYS